jgi:hypothetical protein
MQLIPGSTPVDVPLDRIGSRASLSAVVQRVRPAELHGLGSPRQTITMHTELVDKHWQSAILMLFTLVYGILFVRMHVSFHGERAT